MLERARKRGVQPGIGEHRRILAALKKHDPKAARNAMRDHLGRVIDGLLVATRARRWIARGRRQTASGASIAAGWRCRGVAPLPSRGS